MLARGAGPLALAVGHASVRSLQLEQLWGCSLSLPSFGKLRGGMLCGARARRER